jgi:hypothetical protein
MDHEADLLRSAHEELIGVDGAAEFSKANDCLVHGELRL